MRGIEPKLDRILSRLVRERADWNCELRLDTVLKSDVAMVKRDTPEDGPLILDCFREFPDREQDGKRLQCCHNIGRSERSVRWHGDNLLAGCARCHRYMDLHPEVKRFVWRRELGRSRYNCLVLRGHAPRKYTKSDKQDMAKHYQGEIDRILKLRKGGRLGRIEFTDFD